MAEEKEVTTFISKPCVACGDETIFACSDCAIDSGGKDRVHVCVKDSCRTAHEFKVHRPEEPWYLAAIARRDERITRLLAEIEELRKAKKQESETK